MNNKQVKKSSAGKGDSPRNCFSERYRKNFDLIKWKKDKSIKKIHEENVNL